jgi:hypothetical protein
LKFFFDGCGAFFLKKDWRGDPNTNFPSGSGSVPNDRGLPLLQRSPLRVPRGSVRGKVLKAKRRRRSVALQNGDEDFGAGASQEGWQNHSTRGA